MNQERRFTVNSGIGEVVKHLLLISRESREDLAALLGCHAKTLGRRISGNYDWAGWEVDLMAEHFGVPVALFYEGPAAFLAGAKNIAVLIPEQRAA